MIYKLSANLSQLMNVTVSNDADVSVRGLSVTNAGRTVHCGLFDYRIMYWI